MYSFQVRNLLQNNYFTQIYTRRLRGSVTIYKLKYLIIFPIVD